MRRGEDDVPGQERRSQLQVDSAIAERIIAPTVDTTNNARISLVFHFMVIFLVLR